MRSTVPLKGAVTLTEVDLLVEGGDALLEGLHVGPGLEQLELRCRCLAQRRS